MYCKNYLYYESFGNQVFTNESFWYRRPNENTIADLPANETVNNITQAMSIFPVFKSILDGDIFPHGPVMSSYVSYEYSGMKVTYPAEYHSFYKKFPNQDTQ